MQDKLDSIVLPNLVTVMHLLMIVASCFFNIALHKAGAQPIDSIFPNTPFVLDRGAPAECCNGKSCSATAPCFDCERVHNDEN